MPELPEVETIRNELSPHIIGHTITAVTLFDERIVRQPPVEEFNSRIIGETITEIGRRGKYLFFNLTSGETLVIHLKMTGSLWLKPPDRFTRAVIHLDGDKKIYFRDPRKFGVMWLVEEFNSRLIGETITEIGRRGKYLFFSLTSGQTLIIHLKMTGSLWLTPPDRFTRAVIHLDGDKKIYFRDPRKFGVMWLVENKDTVTDKLGPEPLETGFTAETLAKALAKRTTPIKALLCDQSLIAGIGNMYADEALFLAKIHPMRAGGGLSKKEIERLYQAIRQVLTNAINDKGASVDTYFRPDGQIGTAHFQFRVAHRRGQDCPTCGTPLQRIPVRNRGSYFCPRCQSADHFPADKADNSREQR